MTTVDILYRCLCGSAYFSCQLWRLRLKISRIGAQPSRLHRDLGCAPKWWISNHKIWKLNCMNKMRKKLSMIVLGVVLVMALSVTAFASSAWDSFSTKLPANQGDTEVSTVARASDSVDHFNIQINSLSNGYTAVRAWAEGSWGGNYSDPYWELGVGSNWNVYYYSNNIPSRGTNITLNLDNPVSTTITPSVSGKWTPN